MFNVKYVKILTNDEISVGVEVNGNVVETAADSSRNDFSMLDFDDRWVLGHMLDRLCNWDNDGRPWCPRVPEHHILLVDSQHDEEEEEWEPFCVPIIHE